jgi:hypothetical protein
MWACRRQACESASRCRSTLNNELIFFTGSSSFDRLRCSGPRSRSNSRARATKSLLFFAPRTRKGFVPAGAASANRSTSSREEQTRQGLGKYTRIGRRDYAKLTRFVKRIPTCLAHVGCIDLGEDSETNRGSFRRQATTTKIMGTSRGERLAPLRTDDVANRAQHRRFSVMPQQDRGRGAITNLNGIGPAATRGKNRTRWP